MRVSAKRDRQVEGGWGCMKLERRKDRVDFAIKIAERSIDAMRLSLRHEDNVIERGKLESVAASDLQIALNMVSSAQGFL